MERIYSRRRYLGKKEGFGEYKGNLGRIQRKNECGSKEAREDRYGREKRHKEGRVTRKVHSKDVVWMRWWEIWRGIFEEIREELAKIEDSFSGGETLREG